jgi:hypothetical protein
MKTTTFSAPDFPAADINNVVCTEPMDPMRLLRAKPAYTTRFFAELIKNDASGYTLLSGDDVVPMAGDVVLARVHRLGQHRRIEGPDSRRATLFEGDEVVVAYGHRYAPDQFESEVPGNLDLTNLAAAGGVAGNVTAAHYLMDEPTEIQPLGLLANSSGRVTLQRCAPFAVTTPDEFCSLARVRSPRVVAVLGTSMNSGKTTAVAGIVRGLSRAGLTVAAGKVTGTGAGGDPRLFQDSGASAVMDFTDFGFASTFRLGHDEIRSLLVSLMSRLAATRPDVIVLEVADGLLQRETARLVDDPLFAQLVDKVVFAAGEALGARAGHALLSQRGLAPVAISGLLTASPMASLEASAALEVPVLSVEDLASPDIADLLFSAEARQARLGSVAYDRVAG